MTSPTIEKATQKLRAARTARWNLDKVSAQQLTDSARNAGRSTVALLRDGGYATIGVTDAAVAAVRRIGERAELPDLRKLRNRDELYASLRELGTNVEQRFDALAGRGREVVDSLQHSGATRNVASQARTARSQTKAAVTSIRRAGEAGGEAVEHAATAVGDDTAVNYDALTVAQLRDIARERDLPGRHDMNKAELIAALRKA